MSLNSQFAWIAALVAVISVTSVARAQTMPVSHASHVGLNPFIEPDYFNPDYQFFAPAQVDPYSGGEAPNVGFYGAVDKMYLNVSRPRGDASLNSGYDGDFTWGNRVDLGYMTPERIGWSMSVWHVSGPNIYDSISQERINRHNDNDPSDGLGGGQNQGGGGGGNTVVVLPQDANPRTYDLSPSLNVARFTSFEINRVYRCKELHYGGLFEPFAGFRYMKFIDFGSRSTYNRFASDTNGNLDLTTPAAVGPWEVYQTSQTQFENTMLGAQLGFRYSKQTGHWLLSTELRAFALQNWQFYRLRGNEVQTRYDGTGTTANVDVVLQSATLGNANGSEFVIGGEIRTDASYELTRDVSLRGGFTFLDLGKGVGRGLNPTTHGNNNQDLLMVGVTFGFTVNR